MGGREGGRGGARVSEFFLLRIQIQYIFLFFLGGGGGVGGREAGESDFFYCESKFKINFFGGGGGGGGGGGWWSGGRRG